MLQTQNLNLSSTAIRSVAHESSTNRQERIHANTQIDQVALYIISRSLWNTRIHMLPVAILADEVFPQTIDRLSNELLCKMLSEFIGEDGKVASFMSKRIGVGKGWGGTVHRLYEIEYSSGLTAIAPRSLIFKISTGIWNNDVVTSEPEFYDQLRHRISHMEMPECYYTARSLTDKKQSILLLEDLNETCSAVNFRKIEDERYLLPIVAAVASLHAEFFKQPMLKSENFAWLISPLSKLAHYQITYESLMNNGLLETLNGKISSEAFRYLSTFLERIPDILRQISEENYTLVHGDLWINNMMLRNNEPHRLVLLDWQTCCRANGLFDIAFLMCHISRQRTREFEEHVLEIYHKTLVKYGVTSYTAENLRHDYYTIALPYIFLNFCSWKHRWINKFHEIISLLEDIVLYDHGNQVQSSQHNIK